MLEQVLTRYILHYAQQYIRHIDTDSFSLWSGEVLLQNLALRLDVLSEPLPSSIKLTSGVIKQLKITVPWKAIRSQSVEVILDSVELVFVYNDGEDENPALASESDFLGSQEQATNPTPRGKAGATKTKEQPESWMQPLLLSIVANAVIKVNNLVLKFEHVNSQTLVALTCSCYTFPGSGPKWINRFSYLGSDRMMKKHIQITDLTCDMRPTQKRHREAPCLSRTHIDGFLLFPLKDEGEARLDLHCSPLKFRIAETQVRCINKIISLSGGIPESGESERNTPSASTSVAGGVPLDPTFSMLTANSGNIAPSGQPAKIMLAPSTVEAESDSTGGNEKTPLSAAAHVEDPILHLQRDMKQHELARNTAGVFSPKNSPGSLNAIGSPLPSPLLTSQVSRAPSSPPMSPHGNETGSEKKEKKNKSALGRAWNMFNVFGASTLETENNVEEPVVEPEEPIEEMGLEPPPLQNVLWFVGVYCPLIAVRSSRGSIDVVNVSSGLGTKTVVGDGHVSIDMFSIKNINGDSIFAAGSDEDAFHCHPNCLCPSLDNDRKPVHSFQGFRFGAIFNNESDDIDIQRISVKIPELVFNLIMPTQSTLEELSALYKWIQSFQSSDKSEKSRVGEVEEAKAIMRGILVKFSGLKSSMVTDEGTFSINIEPSVLEMCDENKRCDLRPTLISRTDTLFLPYKRIAANQPTKISSVCPEIHFLGPGNCTYFHLSDLTMMDSVSVHKVIVYIEPRLESLLHLVRPQSSICGNLHVELTDLEGSFRTFGTSQEMQQNESSYSPYMPNSPRKVPHAVAADFQQYYLQVKGLNALFNDENMINAPELMGFLQYGVEAAGAELDYVPERILSMGMSKKRLPALLVKMAPKIHVSPNLFIFLAGLFESSSEPTKEAPPPSPWMHLIASHHAIVRVLVDIEATFGDKQQFPLGPRGESRKDKEKVTKSPIQLSTQADVEEKDVKGTGERRGGGGREEESGGEVGDCIKVYGHIRLQETKGKLWGIKVGPLTCDEIEASVKREGRHVTSVKVSSGVMKFDLTPKRVGEVLRVVNRFFSSQEASSPRSSGTSSLVFFPRSHHTRPEVMSTAEMNIKASYSVDYDGLLFIDLGHCSGSCAVGAKIKSQHMFSSTVLGSSAILLDLELGRPDIVVGGKNTIEYVKVSSSQLDSFSGAVGTGQGAGIHGSRNPGSWAVLSWNSSWTMWGEPTGSVLLSTLPLSMRIDALAILELYDSFAQEVWVDEKEVMSPRASSPGGGRDGDGADPTVFEAPSPEFRVSCSCGLTTIIFVLHEDELKLSLENFDLHKTPDLSYGFHFTMGLLDVSEHVLRCSLEAKGMTIRVDEIAITLPESAVIERLTAFSVIIPESPSSSHSIAAPGASKPSGSGYMTPIDPPSEGAVNFKGTTTTTEFPLIHSTSAFGDEFITICNRPEYLLVIGIVQASLPSDTSIQVHKVECRPMGVTRVTISQIQAHVGTGHQQLQATNIIYTRERDDTTISFTVNARLCTHHVVQDFAWIYELPYMQEKRDRSKKVFGPPRLNDAWGPKLKICIDECNLTFRALEKKDAFYLRAQSIIFGLHSTTPVLPPGHVFDPARMKRGSEKETIVWYPTSEQRMELSVETASLSALEVMIIAPVSFTCDIRLSVGLDIEMSFTHTRACLLPAHFPLFYDVLLFYDPPSMPSMMAQIHFEIKEREFAHSDYLEGFLIPLHVLDDVVGDLRPCYAMKTKYGYIIRLDRYATVHAIVLEMPDQAAAPLIIGRDVTVEAYDYASGNWFMLKGPHIRAETFRLTFGCPLEPPFRLVISMRQKMGAGPTQMQIRFPLLRLSLLSPHHLPLQGKPRACYCECTLESPAKAEKCRFAMISASEGLSISIRGATMHVALYRQQSLELDTFIEAGPIDFLMDMPTTKRPPILAPFACRSSTWTIDINVGHLWLVPSKRSIFRVMDIGMIFSASLQPKPIVAPVTIKNALNVTLSAGQCAGNVHSSEVGVATVPYPIITILPYKTHVYMWRSETHKKIRFALQGRWSPAVGEDITRVTFLNYIIQCNEEGSIFEILPQCVIYSQLPFPLTLLPGPLHFSPLNCEPYTVSYSDSLASALAQGTIDARTGLLTRDHPVSAVLSEGQELMINAGTERDVDVQTLKVSLKSFASILEFKKGVVMVHCTGEEDAPSTSCASLTSPEERNVNKAVTRIIFEPALCFGTRCPFPMTVEFSPGPRVRYEAIETTDDEASAPMVMHMVNDCDPRRLKTMTVHVHLDDTESMSSTCLLLDALTSFKHTRDDGVLVSWQNQVSLHGKTRTAHILITACSSPLSGHCFSLTVEPQWTIANHLCKPVLLSSSEHFLAAPAGSSTSLFCLPFQVAPKNSFRAQFALNAESPEWSQMTETSKTNSPSLVIRSDRIIATTSLSYTHKIDDAFGGITLHIRPACCVTNNLEGVAKSVRMETYNWANVGPGECVSLPRIVGDRWGTLDLGKVAVNLTPEAPSIIELDAGEVVKVTSAMDQNQTLAITLSQAPYNVVINNQVDEDISVTFQSSTRHVPANSIVRLALSELRGEVNATWWGGEPSATSGVQKTMGVRRGERYLNVPMQPAKPLRTTLGESDLVVIFDGTMYLTVGNDLPAAPEKGPWLHLYIQAQELICPLGNDSLFTHGRQVNASLAFTEYSGPWTLYTEMDISSSSLHVLHSQPSLQVLDLPPLAIYLHLAQTSARTWIEDFRFSLHPSNADTVVARVEEYVIPTLMKIVEEWSGASGSNSNEGSSSDKKASESTVEESSIFVRNVVVSKLPLCVTVKLSRISFTDFRVDVKGWKVENWTVTAQQASSALISHVVSHILINTPHVLGSWDLLGNPSKVYRHLQEGFENLFTSRGTEGLRSFSHHLMCASMFSVEAISDSVRRNLPAATGNASGGGLKEGFRHFLGGFERGVQGVIRPNENEGLARGLVGVVTQPMSGVLDFVTVTARAWTDVPNHSPCVCESKPMDASMSPLLLVAQYMDPFSGRSELQYKDCGGSSVVSGTSSKMLLEKSSSPTKEFKERYRLNDIHQVVFWAACEYVLMEAEVEFLKVVVVVTEDLIFVIPRLDLVTQISAQSLPGPWEIDKLSTTQQGTVFCIVVDDIQVAQFRSDAANDVLACTSRLKRWITKKNTSRDALKKFHREKTLKKVADSIAKASS